MPTCVGRHQRWGGGSGRLCCGAASETSCAHVHASSIKSCALMQARNSEKGSGKIDGWAKRDVGRRSAGESLQLLCGSSDRTDRISTWDRKKGNLCLLDYFFVATMLRPASLKNMTKIPDQWVDQSGSWLAAPVKVGCATVVSRPLLQAIVIWEDGVWPHTAERWRCHCLQNLIFIIPLHWNDLQWWMTLFRQWGRDTISHCHTTHFHRCCQSCHWLAARGRNRSSIKTKKGKKRKERYLCLWRLRPCGRNSGPCPRRWRSLERWRNSPPPRTWCPARDEEDNEQKR